MKKTLIFTAIIFLSINYLSAQDVIIDENPQENYGDERTFGANKTHFVHSFINLGFAANKSEGSGANILFGASHSINYGLRYKLKLAEFLALGFDIAYNYEVFYLKQELGKLIPTPELHEKEKFKFHKATSTLFFRINYDKRGDILGKYIDLGAFGSYTYSAIRQYYDVFQATNPILDHEFTIFEEKNLQYFEKLNYGAICRIGFDKFGLYGKYRLSDLFTKDFKTGISTAELPRLEIGLEMAIYQKN